MARSRAARRPAPAPAPAPAAPRRARLPDIPPLRYTGYVAAAAVLHGGLWLLQTRGLRVPAPPGEPWIPHLCLLLGMVGVRVFAAHGLRVAMVTSVVATLAVVRPAWGFGLGVILFLTWYISRLSLGAPARIALVLAANGLLPAVRAGLLGPEAAAQLTAGPTLLWPVLLLRSLMYQMEVPRLLPHERGFLAYLGSFTAIPLAGGGYLQPITYRRFLGEYGTAAAEKNVRAGLGLLALGALYLWLKPTLVEPHASGFLRGLAGAVHQGGLDAALAARGHGTVALALCLVQVERYLTIAGFTFYLIGNLRLLGFNLASGYHYPFISRSFVDLWQRTNFYLRECQLVLYYMPVAKLLRHRLGHRLTAAISATAAIAGHLAVAIFLNHFIVTGLSSAHGVRYLLLDAGRFGVIGVLTILSVLRLRAIAQRGDVSWPRRIWQTVFVIAIAATNLAVWELFMVGLSWPQAMTVLRFAVTGG